MLTAVRELGDVDWSGLRFALGGRLPGVVLGSWIVVTQPARTTAVVVAVVVLGAVALSATSWDARPTPRALAVAGVVSGVSGTATSIGGPPVAMLYQRAGGSVLRSTMGVYFLVGNVLSVGALALAGEIGQRDLLRALALLPFLRRRLLDLRAAARARRRRAPAGGRPGAVRRRRGRPAGAHAARLS